jgi:frataxin-like iron-binding protein CyaY
MEAEFEREVLDRLIKIEEKLDGYNNAKIKTYENEKEILRIKSDLEDVQKTVADLTESNKWLFRTVVAAIIVAAIGLLTTIVRTSFGL